MLLYRFLRFLLRIAVAVFYKDVYVQGRSLLPSKGPLIVSVNHPNTVMDPIVVALQLRQRTGFLANGGIFANSMLKWVFKKLHLIPVYRPQDVKEGEKPDNTATFRKSYEYLLNGGTLLIFPEGSSVHEMKLRKLKTGTARIALETAAQKQFRSGLQIVTVSLNYSDPLYFRTRLSILVEVPINVDSYAAAYHKDPVAAVQELTDLMRMKLQKNMVIAEHKEHELLLKRIKKLYTDYLEEDQKETLSREEEFRLLQQLGNAIQQYEMHKPADYMRIRDKVTQYFDSLEQLELKEGYLSASFSRRRKIAFLFSNMLLLLLSFPLYVLGLLTNYLPYTLPARLAKALGTDPEYRAGIMMLSGLVFFPLYYGLLIWLFQQQFSVNIVSTVLFAVALPVLGFFSLFYWQVVEKTVSLFRYLRLWLTKKQLLQQLTESRRDILQELIVAADTLNASAVKL